MKMDTNLTEMAELSKTTCTLATGEGCKEITTKGDEYTTSNYSYHPERYTGRLYSDFTPPLAFSIPYILISAN